MFTRTKLIFFKAFQFLSQTQFEKIDILKIIESDEWLLNRIKSDISIKCHINNSPKEVSVKSMFLKKNIWEIMIYGNNDLSLIITTSENRVEKNKNLIKFYASIKNDEGAIINFENFMKKNPQFQWGYICTMDSSYSLTTETKRNWLTGSTKSGKIGWKDWEKISDGYVPRLYEVNFLNSSQIQKLEDYIPHNNIEKINDDLSIIRLNEKQLKSINKASQTNKFEYLIYT